MRVARSGVGQFAAKGLLEKAKLSILEQREIEDEVRFFALIGGDGRTRWCSLVWFAPSKHHSLEGREHGRTIPLAVSRCFARINSGVLCTLTPPEKPVGF